MARVLDQWRTGRGVQLNAPTLMPPVAGRTDSYVHTAESHPGCRFEKSVTPPGAVMCQRVGTCRRVAVVRSRLWRLRRRAETVDEMSKPLEEKRNVDGGDRAVAVHVCILLTIE